VSPSALAVDLGSSTTAVWATDRGVVSAPSKGSALVRRGRIADPAGTVALLQQLIKQYAEPVPAVDLVVACRPVLSSDAEQALIRRVVDTAFTPRRTLLIETVRAAAIGSGADAGSLLVADIGAELTEVALLRQGRVTAARRTDIGTRDLRDGATVDLLTDVVARHLDDLRAACPAAELAEATARGLLLAGDGAGHPELPDALAESLRMRVHRAAEPHSVALHGAGRAATAAMRHPAHR
jgi:rod shape-determining protein MreB